MNTTINIIQEIQGGNAQQPSLFYSPDKAGRCFEEIVTARDVAFRKKTENESWDEYDSAFQHWFDDPAITKPFDTADWEIKWFKEQAEDDDQYINVKIPLITKSFDGFEIHPCNEDENGNVDQCE
jgi:hypothetical protein